MRFHTGLVDMHIAQTLEAVASLCGHDDRGDITVLIMFTAVRLLGECESGLARYHAIGHDATSGMISASNIC